MTMTTITNDFTGEVISVNTSKPLTAAKIRGWRRKLHNNACASGDDLGGRGPQADAAAYDELLSRAQRVMATGISEV